MELKPYAINNRQKIFKFLRRGEGFGASSARGDPRRDSYFLEGRAIPGKKRVNT